MEYSIVIPAFNESDKITSTLTSVLGFMRTFSKDFEVIVGQDGQITEYRVLMRVTFILEN